jgi:aminoglycoside phosphotransferase (APT) family kinase protein
MTNAAVSDLDLAAQIATAYLRRPLHTVAPIRGKGSVNLIFTAQARNAAVVVRMSKPEDVARGLLFYEKEAWCLAQAAGVGIPGPQVLEIGRREGRPYMLQTLVKGVNGEDSGLPAADIWRVLGQYARRIHDIAVDGFGETLADFHQGDAQAAWRAHVDYNLRSLTADDALLRLNVYRPEQAEAIREVFRSLRRGVFRIGLNHYDLAIRNTIVDAREQVTLLDWGSAEAHLVPHYDLLEILRRLHPEDARFHAFLGGYGLDEGEFAALLVEVRSLALLKAFDLTRWAIDRCQMRIGEIAEQARQVVAGTWTGHSALLP